MAKIMMTSMAVPNVAFRFRLATTALASSVGIMGRSIRDGLRKYTPKRTWHMYRTCGILKQYNTLVVGRVTVGWRRVDFDRDKFYPYFVGEGTGAQKPGGKPIVAKRSTPEKKRLIRYQYQGNWVSMSSVKGIKPKKILEQGYKEAIPEILLLCSRTAFDFVSVYKRV